MRLPILLMLLSCIFLFPQNQKNYKIFMLREADGNIFLDTLLLNEGESRIYNQHDLITFILPVSYGKSGDIIQEVHRNNRINISAHNGEITYDVIKPDGSKRALPSVKLNELQKYFIRINVTGSNDVKKAFYINNYDEYGIIDGPVIDMFGGKVPLGINDYSITTETTEVKKKVNISGSASLEIHNNLLFVKGSINGGEENYYIIDLGAGRTVISKEFLPAENEIAAVQKIEYSSEGSKVSEGEMGAAGGNVSGFLGNSIITLFTFGNLTLENIKVSILERLPVIADKKVAGIIGMDIIQSSSVVSIEYNFGNPGKIIFTDSFENGSSPEIRFSLTGSQIFIEGQINDKEITFLFDTGARYSFVSESAGLKTSETEPIELRGLDGNIISAKMLVAEKFYLNGQEFNFKKFYSADLHVMNSMGLKDSGALLGGDFFSSFKTITIDFTKKLIFLNDSL